MRWTEDWTAVSVFTSLLISGPYQLRSSPVSGFFPVLRLDFQTLSVDTPGPCQTCQTRDPYPKKPGPVLLGYGYGRVRVRVWPGTGTGMARYGYGSDIFTRG